MLNQTVLVGRIYNIVDYTFMNGGIKLVMVIPRSIKNEEGMYPNDYITVQLKGSVANNTLEYCKVGDIVGVKGTLQCENEYDAVTVIAEKITFLSSSKGGE
jgi:single-stranded DNA-binding protein